MRAVVRRACALDSTYALCRWRCTRLCTRTAIPHCRTARILRVTRLHCTVRIPLLRIFVRAGRHLPAPTITFPLLPQFPAAGCRSTVAPVHTRFLPFSPRACVGVYAARLHATCRGLTHAYRVARTAVGSRFTALYFASLPGGLHLLCTLPLPRIVATRRVTRSHTVCLLVGSRLHCRVTAPRACSYLLSRRGSAAGLPFWFITAAAQHAPRCAWTPVSVFARTHCRASVRHTSLARIMDQPLSVAAVYAAAPRTAYCHFTLILPCLFFAAWFSSRGPPHYRLACTWTTAVCCITCLPTSAQHAAFTCLVYRLPTPFTPVRVPLRRGCLPPRAPDTY